MLQKQELIDFSRVGNLLSSHHRYSVNELITRVYIIGITAVFSIIGHTLFSFLSPDYRLAVAVLFGLMGFILSHTQVILPLIRKRQARLTSIEQLISDIQACIQLAPNEKQTEYQLTLENILAQSATTHHGRQLSQTLGKRFRLLTAFKNDLSSTKATETPFKPAL